MISKKYNYFLFTIIICMIFLIYLFGWHNFWENIGINTISPNFYDFRKVQQLSQTINLDNYNYQFIYTDSTVYPFNYPFLWIYIGKFLKLQNELNFNIFILLFISLYIFTFFINIKKHNYSIYILLFLSNSSLLLIERGNVDIIIYVLLFLSLKLNSEFLRLCLYTLLSIIKIFPTVLLFAFKKLNFKYVLSYFFICIIILFILRHDLKYILINTPVPALGSYGIKSFHKLSIERLNLHISSIYFYILFFILFLLFFKFFYKKIMINNTSDYDYLSFKVGASVFVFTFILMGNFDYRLIFLIFCIPLVYNLKNIHFRNIILLTLIISMNIYYMKLFFGKTGVIVNLFCKIILFYSLTLILFKIILNSLTSNNIIINRFIKYIHS